MFIREWSYCLQSIRTNLMNFCPFTPYGFASPHFINTFPSETCIKSLKSCWDHPQSIKLVKTAQSGLNFFLHSKQKQDYCLLSFIPCIPITYLFSCVSPWAISSILFIHVPSHAFELPIRNNHPQWSPSVLGLSGRHKHWETLALRTQAVADNTSFMNPEPLATSRLFQQLYLQGNFIHVLTFPACKSSNINSRMSLVG